MRQTDCQQEQRGKNLKTADLRVILRKFKTRSKGSENLPQGFAGLTLICKDFQGMKEIIYFCQKNKSTILTKK